MLPPEVFSAHFPVPNRNTCKHILSPTAISPQSYLMLVFLVFPFFVREGVQDQRWGQSSVVSLFPADHMLWPADLDHPCLGELPGACAQLRQTQPLIKSLKRHSGSWLFFIFLAFVLAHRSNRDGDWRCLVGWLWRKLKKAPLLPKEYKSHVRSLPREIWTEL